MFELNHFIWIGICIVMITGLMMISVRKKYSVRQAGYIMSAICVLSEISKIFSDMTASASGGMHLDPLSLPFHLCSLMIFMVFYLTFGNEGYFRRVIMNFVAVMGTLGSICAILIPTNGTDFGSILPYQCFVYHAGLLWFGLYLIISGNAVLDIRSMKENMLMMSILVIMTLYVNGALSVYDTNFFYLTRPPMENLPYLNLEKGWYVYFVRIVILGLAVIGMAYCPFLIRGNRKTVSEKEG